MDVKMVGLLLVGLLLLGCTTQTPPSTTATPQGTATVAATVDENVPPLPPDNTLESTATPNAETATPPGTVPTKEFTVTAKTWEFQPSTITVKQGDRVKLKITSVDVNHGFNLPEFNVKANLQPNQEATVEFTASKKGTFNFFCDVFCGEGHQNMKGQLTVE